MIYRGENEWHLKQKLVRTKNHFSPPDLYRKLFYIGDKANIYLENQFKVMGNYYLGNINALGQESFEILFDHLTEALENAANNNKENIKRFISNNPTFVDYFRNDNKERFSKNITGHVFNQREKQVILGYYLYLLHTLGDDARPEMSKMLSTTTNFSQAKKFAKGKVGDRSNNYNGLVIFAFIGNNTKFITGSMNDKFKELEIPVYVGSPYHWQKEIGLIGVLFPHNILGVLNISNNQFVISPYLLEFLNSRSDMSELYKYVKIRGCYDKDQSDFDIVIQETNYRGKFEQKGNTLKDKSIDR